MVKTSLSKDLNRGFIRAAVIILLVPLCGCSRPGIPERSKGDWLQQMIAGFQREPVANPPRKIYKCGYKGAVAYYVPPVCCDQYSALYDVNGLRLCAPDGGMTGGGDGKCPEFCCDTSSSTVVWSDPRTGQ